MSAAPDLLVKAVTYNSVELSWDENNNIQQRGSRKLYHVKLDRARGRSPCPGGPILDPLTNYQGYAQRNVFSGLDPMTQYLARIKVLEDEKGEEGFWSEAISICTEKEPPSGAELHRAVAREDNEQVRKILGENSAVVEVMDKFGYTPLMVAAQKGFIGVIKVLLECGADPNYVNSSGKTCLMIACYAGQEDVVKLLRKYGVTWDSRDKNGLTAVHWAADGGQDDVLLWMLRDGAKVDSPDSLNGWTPLMRLACLSGNEDVAEVLIAKQADVNKVDNSGKTVLMAAAMNGHFNLVRLLVEKGADIYKKNREGKTALDFAQSFERLRVIKYLEYQVQKDEKQRKAKLVEEMKQTQIKSGLP